MLKVAVITPSVNTEYLIRAIKSVQNQTLECKHYVVNDGKDDFSWGGEHVINLPENTGRADGVIWNGHRIYAGLPFMLNADYVIFLDEDNWFDENHVESMVNLCESENLDWCFSLRKIVNQKGEYVCNDDCESLGNIADAIGMGHGFVDTNCYCIRGNILPSVSPAWMTPAIGDRTFYLELAKKYPNFKCTNQYTVNYTTRDALLPMFINNPKKDKNMPKVFLATPMYGGMCTGYYTQSILQLNNLLRDSGVDCMMSFMFNESLITRARNGLAKAFLDTDCTHLFFVDADIRFQAQDVIRMLNAEKEVICGIYPKKEVNWDTVRRAMDNGVSNDELKRHTGSFVVNLVNYVNEVTVPVGEPVEIFNGGTGFMLIKRGVFDELRDHVPTYTNDVHDLGNTLKSDLIHEYFTTSIEDGTNRLLSEDYHFCNIYRKIGGKIYAAPWAQLAHIGTYCFEGQLTPAS